MSGPVQHPLRPAAYAAYAEYGYEVLALPRASVAQRADFVLARR